MTTEMWLAVIGALLGPMGLVAGGVAIYQQRAKLKAVAPQATADTNAVNLEAQGKTVDRLTSENKRLSNRLDNAETKIDALLAALTKAESKIDELEAREEARDVLLREHALWDDELEMAVHKMGHITVSARPPLTLPPAGQKW